MSAFSQAIRPDQTAGQTFKTPEGENAPPLPKVDHFCEQGYRLAVRGGWAVAFGNGAFFLPDPNHEWDTS